MSGFVSTPVVSVVIPAYKARNYLRQSLASASAQDYSNIEILVIDDASPEPIDDIIAGYQGHPAAPIPRIIRHSTNQGLGASRNTGIHEAKGEYVAFLDHDDLWAPNHVSSLLETALRSQADMAFCTVKQFHAVPEDDMGNWGPDIHDLGDAFPMALFTKSFITPSATLVRRQLLLDLLGFNTDPRVHMCEDLDLWLRMLEIGARFAYSEDITCYYRKHDEAATSRAGYMAYQSAYVRETHFGKVRGGFFRKCSVVAGRWWDAFRILPGNATCSRRALIHAILWSLPVPWEIARGLVRLFRRQRARHP